MTYNVCGGMLNLALSISPVPQSQMSHKDDNVLWGICAGLNLADFHI